MKKAIIAPDSFKGTLSAKEVCAIMKAGILRHFPDCRIVSIPIADGGEGTVDCFIEAIGGQKMKSDCTGPLFESVSAEWCILPEERTGGIKTAVIEMAAAAGLPLIGDRKNPGTATTYGVGELIGIAIGHGCRRIILGLGGSCTNDFGCGAAAALGVRFFDTDGCAFVPTGATLSKVARIDTENSVSLTSDMELTIMCDIENPAFGENGAAYVFAPQKGADELCVRMLDDGLRHICDVVKHELGKDVSSLPGGGAAGAMGAGMNAFFGAKLLSGIDTVLDTVGFDNALTDADIVFTGEGCLDEQSIHGKVLSGVGKRAKAAGVPVIAVAGGIKEGIDAIYENGITAAFSINRLPVDFSISRYKSAENLEAVFDNILRLINTGYHTG